MVDVTSEPIRGSVESEVVIIEGEAAIASDGFIEGVGLEGVVSMWGSGESDRRRFVDVGSLRKGLVVGQDSIL